MKKKKNIRLTLTPAEKEKLRKSKTSQKDLLELAADEIEVMLQVPAIRAKEIKAMGEFQTIPSVGIKFAEDLIFLGYYSINDLIGKNGPGLLEDYEAKKGYWTDPCVEDQFWLAVYYAKNRDSSKNWWDFTKDRKTYRMENGYPPNRPVTPWHEVIEIRRKVPSQDSGKSQRSK